MPWFPDFAAAAELARRETRETGHADPVAEYFAALDKGDTRALEKVWPGEVLIHDPRAGVIRGHKQLKQFVEQNRDFWATRLSHVEAVASTYDGGRAVVEVMVHLVLDGAEMPWPIAVVAESPDDRSVVFRTYCSQVPVTGRHEVRPPVLDAGIGGLDGAVGRYQAAVEAGDVDEVVKTFAPDGYVREPIGPHAAHRGTRELRGILHEVLQRRRRHRVSELRRDRRRPAMCSRVQLRPLGELRPATTGGHGGVRARFRRVAGGDSRL